MIAEEVKLPIMSETLKVLKMLGEWIFVRRIEEPRVVGKILLPDTVNEITQKGEVVAAGEKGDKNIKLGDEILFRRKSAFKNVDVDGEKLLVMKKDKVLGVMFGDGVTDVNPVTDHVFLEWEKSPDEYEKMGLIRPESYKEMYFTGVVLAVGPDVKEIVVGDRVFFDQFCGVEKFQEDGKRFGFVREGDVYCNGLPKRDQVPA